MSKKTLLRFVYICALAVAACGGPEGQEGLDSTVGPGAAEQADETHSETLTDNYDLESQGKVHRLYGGCYSSQICNAECALGGFGHSHVGGWKIGCGGWGAFRYTRCTCYN